MTAAKWNIILIATSALVLTISLACTPEKQNASVPSVVPSPSPTIPQPKTEEQPRAPRSKRMELSIGGVTTHVKNVRYMPDSSVCVDMIVERKEFCFKTSANYMLLGE